MTPTPERELAIKLFELIEGKPISHEDIETLVKTQSMIKNWQDDERSVMLTRALFEVLPKVEQARLDERERCAKIVETIKCPADDCCGDQAFYAAQIREGK